MGTFDVHSEIAELEPLQSPQGLAAIGLFQLMGSWTSLHGRTGYVPDSALIEHHGRLEHLTDPIDRLVRAGLWRRDGDGYTMLRGPHSDPDQPMPLWRYTDTDLGGRLFAVDDTPNN